MAIVAEPWPSQRRHQSSERHSALARMKQRRTQMSPEPDEGSFTPRCPPLQNRSSSRSKAPPEELEPPLHKRGLRTHAADEVEPAAMAYAADLNSARPSSRRDPTRSMGEGESRRHRNSDRASMCDGLDLPDETMPRREKPPRPERSERGDTSSRVRGPATARSARSHGSKAPDTCDDDNPLPAGVAADFNKLQELISNGIKEAEHTAAMLETNVQDDEAEYQRHLEENRRKREEEAEARRQERERAKQERRRAEEERQRRQMEEMQQQEEQEIQKRHQEQQEKENRSRQANAAVQIQKHIRGKRSRAGLPTSSTPSPSAAAGSKLQRQQPELLA